MQKISYQQNFKISKSIEQLKSYNFPHLFTTTNKLKNYEEVLLAQKRLHGDEDYCQKPVQ